MLILNEKRYIEDIMNSNEIVKSSVRKIGYLARYLIQINHLSNDEAYNTIVNWMKKNQDGFDESSYSNVISNAIKKAKKYPIYEIECLKITKSEFEIIKNLNNLREEKIAFVLLCMAKHQEQTFGFKNGLVKYSLTDLCKDARISVPANEREYILYSLIQKNILSCPKKNDTECLIVNFISYDDTNVFFTIDENECKELAYVYLYYKNEQSGFIKCKNCGRYMRQFKAKPKKYCEKCSKEFNLLENQELKKCISCGKTFVINKKDTHSKMCDDCQNESTKESKRNWWNKNKN